MSITRIGRLRDYGIFRDFTWPSNLPEFGRYNLIYAWNWSGKTTLSRLFRALEDRTAPVAGQVTVIVDGHKVSNENFGQVAVPIRVFNRDFVAESVFPTEGDVAPIFILGKQKQVDQLETTLAQQQTKLRHDRKKLTDGETELDKFCIDRAKVIKETLTTPTHNN